MPSGPGLERFCFHSKQCRSGCGRASEYRAVEPSDNQRTGKLAGEQTKQAKKKKNSYTEGCEEVSSTVVRGQQQVQASAAWNLAQLCPAGKQEGRGHWAGCAIPENGLSKFSLLCASPRWGMWQRRWRGVVSRSPLHLIIPWCSSQNREIPWEQKNQGNSYLGIGKPRHDFTQGTWCKAQRTK